MATDAYGERCWKMAAATRGCRGPCIPFVLPSFLLLPPLLHLLAWGVFFGGGRGRKDCVWAARADERQHTHAHVHTSLDNTAATFEMPAATRPPFAGHAAVCCVVGGGDVVMEMRVVGRSGLGR